MSRHLARIKRNLPAFTGMAIPRHRRCADTLLGKTVSKNQRFRFVGSQRPQSFGVLEFDVESFPPGASLTSLVLAGSPRRSFVPSVPSCARESRPLAA